MGIHFTAFICASGILLNSETLITQLIQLLRYSQQNQWPICTEVKKRILMRSDFYHIFFASTNLSAKKSSHFFLTNLTYKSYYKQNLLQDHCTKKYVKQYLLKIQILTSIESVMRRGKN